MATTKQRGIGLQARKAVVGDDIERGTMSLGGLVFVGIGGIIGAGYFLGVGLAIEQAGPGIFIGFVLGALVLSQVLGAVTTLSVNHPVKGSFRTYAEEMFGPFIGYFQGWLYWLAAVLTIGSESIAMAVFSRLWLPHMPLWALALLFTGLVLLLNAFGVAAFTKLEGALSALKILALIFFSAVILLVGLRVFGGPPVHVSYLWQHGGFLPHGMQGVLQSMLIVIFAYSGLGVMATATTELKHPLDAGAGASWVIIGLTAIYMVSLLALLVTIPWWQIGVASSPFVSALAALHLGLFASLFNAVILVAAFTVMAGALFSAVLILQNMASVKEAPHLLQKRRGRYGTSIPALLVSCIGAAVAIAISYALPSKVYSYLISATSFITFFNWVVILLSWLRYKKRNRAVALYEAPWIRFGPYTIWATIAFIAALALFSLGSADQRLGGLAALVLAALIALPYPLVARGKRNETSGH